MVIAIDGPAGSGKSSTAKAVAAALGIVHLDTGAMYRAVTLKALRACMASSDTERLGALMQGTRVTFTGSPPSTLVWLDGEDVSEAIRGDDVTRNVSDYCQPTVVRSALVEQQREIGSRFDCVCEGRDIGTVVFPAASLKFFMTASVSERAKRRQKDFEKLGVTKSLEDLEAEITLRDLKDSSRANSPLTCAADAEVIDTTSMTLQQQIDYIVAKARPLLGHVCGA